MASIFKIRVIEETVAGAPRVYQFNSASPANTILIECVAGGPIVIEGSSGDIGGVPVTTQNLPNGLWKEYGGLDGFQYDNLQFTIPIGCEYRLTTEGG